MMEEEDGLAHAIRDRKRLLKSVLGNKKAKELEKEKNKDDNKRISELALPKDKWKRGK